MKPASLEKENFKNCDALIMRLYIEKHRFS